MTEADFSVFTETTISHQSLGSVYAHKRAFEMQVHSFNHDAGAPSPFRPCCMYSCTSATNAAAMGLYKRATRQPFLNT